MTTSVDDPEGWRALASVRATLDGAIDAGPVALAEWCRQLARVVEPLGGVGLASLARAAGRAGSPEPGALVALGRRLCAEGSPRTAATLLAGAHRYAPDDPAIVIGRIEALGAAGLHAEACRVLHEIQPWMIGGAEHGAALAWHAALSGDLAEAERQVPELLRSDVAEHRARGEALTGMLARAAVVRTISPLDASDLRGWHFVITGGLLLHRSPEGRATMHGRYGFVHDGYDDCLAGVRRADAVLTALGLPIERVLAPSDRDSAILALAAAGVLGRRVAPLADAEPDVTSLVVIYDISRLAPEQCASLATHRHRQVVYTHAASWTEASPFATDLVTRLHQHGRAPWDPHQALDPSSNELTDVPGDRTGIAVLAERIAGATLATDALADLPSLVAFARAAANVRGAHAAGALRSECPRRPFPLGSPVASVAL